MYADSKGNFRWVKLSSSQDTILFLLLKYLKTFYSCKTMDFYFLDKILYNTNIKNSSLTH